MNFFEKMCDFWLDKPLWKVIYNINGCLYASPRPKEKKGGNAGQKTRI